MAASRSHAGATPRRKTRLSAALTLLARDVSDRPRAIRAVPRKFLEDYEALGGTGVDLDAPLSDDA